MNDIKTKLTEIISNTQYGNGSKIGDNFQKAFIEKIADHLIANGVTVQKWIPRTEPPKKSGRYLCRYVFNDNYDMPFEQVLSYYSTDEKPHFRNEGDELGMKVTHWMPLPEPPKEVSQ